MKKKLLALSVVGALACTSSIVMAGMEDKSKQNRDEGAKVETSGSVEALALAAELAALGTAQKDPLLLAAALRLQSAVEVEAKTQDKTTKGDEAKEGKKEESSSDLAALAREYAGENESLLAVVDMATTDSASRGRVGGAVRGHTDRVQAGRTDVYTIEFRGGQTAEVAVIGDGDTDLDLFIYDENGNFICEDTLRDDYPVCEWNPRWTGEFEIQIQNLGSVYNEYELYTN